MPEPIYGGSSNNWSGNDWAGEFAGTGSTTNWSGSSNNNNSNNNQYGGYSTPQEEAAAGMATAGQVAGNLGTGLFEASPVQYPDNFYDNQGNLTPDAVNLILTTDDPTDISGFQYGLPDNVFYSTYGPGTTSYAYGSNPYDWQNPEGAGYIYIDPITGDSNAWNPWPSGGGGGGGGGYGWGSGGGGGGSRGSGGGSRMQFPGAEGAGGMRGRWGQSTIQGDYIRRMRGYNRGGIVSLC